METKRKFFIYDRKEVGILILLGVGVSLFAFTLGVHLGKQVSPPPVVEAEEHEPTEKVDTTHAPPPNRTEISEQVKNVPGAVDDALDQSLRDEVVRNGLQVATPKPLTLPEKTISKTTEHEEAAAPAAEAPAETHAATESAPKSLPRKTAARAGKRYALQIGSYTVETEAKDQLSKVGDLGVPTQVKQVNIEGKGTWFRVLVGDYPSIEEADSAGKTFKAGKKIDDYRVVRASADGEKSGESR